jgi:hypothetical protein
MKLLRRILAICLILVLLAAAGAGLLLYRQRAVIQTLEERIDAVTAQTIPVRFMVLSRSDADVSARFRFYDADGREIASFERSWKGSELAIDSLIVPLGKRALVFPVRVFTDAVAPAKGTELFPYYDKAGVPAILDSPGLDDHTRAALRDLFTRVKAAEGRSADGADGHEPGTSIRGYFGNAVHDLKRFNRFEIGAVYALVAHADGGVEIIRE